MKFKNFQVAWRLSIAMQDMCFKGLEKNWNVPEADSIYLDAQKSRGFTKEKYSEVIFGFRF